MSLDLQALGALLAVVAIDVALAGDNAVVVGMVAAGLPPALRRRAILAGIGAAAALRIVFAIFAVQMLSVVGLVLAGGLLLLWVSWKLWRELRSQAAGHHPRTEAEQQKGFRQAVTRIVVADLSMSLDNVLAVAGAAREHPSVLLAGLALSVALMGLAAELVVRLLQRHRWVAYGGLLIVLGVALDMIYDGIRQLIG